MIVLGSFLTRFTPRQAPDAWLDAEKWDRWVDELLAKVATAKVEHPERFTGCFVGTAMNHSAARYTEIAEQPITAGTAIPALRAALVQFRSQDGELNDRMLADGKPGSDYPLARIAAMHTYRLATVPTPGSIHVIQFISLTPLLGHYINVTHMIPGRSSRRCSIRTLSSSSLATVRISSVRLTPSYVFIYEYDSRRNATLVCQTLSGTHLTNLVLRITSCASRIAHHVLRIR